MGALLSGRWSSYTVKILRGICTISLLLLATPGGADTGNIPFNGSVPGTCTITALSTGELQVDGTFQNMNSLTTPSTAQVVTTSDDFSISLDAPSFTRPATDTTPVTTLGGAYHPVTYSGDNGHLVNRFDTDAPQTVNRGTIGLNLFFFAGKSGSDIFTAGSYSADVMLRCE